MQAVEVNMLLYKEGEPVDQSMTKPLIPKIIAIMEEAGLKVRLDMRADDFTDRGAEDAGDVSEEPSVERKTCGGCSIPIQDTDAQKQIPNGKLYHLICWERFMKEGSKQHYGDSVS